MTKQTVVRTRSTDEGYFYQPDAFSKLAAALDDGYRVVMCNRVGDDLEYILEKPIKIDRGRAVEINVEVDV